MGRQESPHALMSQQGRVVSIKSPSAKRQRSSSPTDSDNGGAQDSDEDGEDGEDKEYVVDRVMGRRKVDGQIEYKLRWVGYGPEDDTWEPESNLSCAEKLNEFHRKRFEVYRPGKKPQKQDLLVDRAGSSTEEEQTQQALAKLKEREAREKEERKSQSPKKGRARKYRRAPTPEDDEDEDDAPRRKERKHEASTSSSWQVLAEEKKQRKLDEERRQRERSTTQDRHVVKSKGIFGPASIVGPDARSKSLTRSPAPTIVRGSTQSYKGKEKAAPEPSQKKKKRIRSSSDEGSEVELVSIKKKHKSKKTRPVSPTSVGDEPGTGDASSDEDGGKRRKERPSKGAVAPEVDEERRRLEAELFSQEAEEEAKLQKQRDKEERRAKRNQAALLVSSSAAQSSPKGKGKAAQDDDEDSDAPQGLTRTYVDTSRPTQAADNSFSDSESSDENGLWHSQPTAAGAGTSTSSFAGLAGTTTERSSLMYLNNPKPTTLLNPKSAPASGRPTASSAASAASKAQKPVSIFMPKPARGGKPAAPLKRPKDWVDPAHLNLVAVGGGLPRR